MVWKTLGSYSAGCFLFPVLYGHFSQRKISDNAFVASCLTGVVTMTFWTFIKRTGFWADVDALYIGVLSTSLFLFSEQLIYKLQYSVKP